MKNFYVFFALLGVNYVLCTSTVSESTDKALITSLQYVEEGDIAFGSGDVKNSLAFYRAAVRLSPSNQNFWTKLGTVEYNLNDYEKSKSRFERVLSLDPGSSTAKYYLKQLNSKLKSKDVCFDDSCESSDAPNDELLVLSIPEYPNRFVLDQDTNAYTVESFDEISDLPFIVRQALPHMNWNVDAFSLMNLVSLSGSNVVDFYPQNMLSRPEKNFNVPLSEAIDFLDFPEGAYLSVDISEPGTYIQWNLNSTLWKESQVKGNVNLSPFYVNSLQLFFQQYHQNNNDEHNDEDMKLISELSEYFELRTHWNMLLIGEKGSGMFNHQDALPVGSWQAQLSGSKHFKICTPPPAPHRASTRHTSESVVNPKASEGPCYEGTSQAGDFLYYPPHFFHQTLNTEGPSIALSGTLILDKNKQEFKDLLVRECGPLKEKNYDFSAEFCQFILSTR